ncbi:MAG: DUF58 domain-containing protein, partial [Candidatus Dadabacteria bacterium]
MLTLNLLIFLILSGYFLATASAYSDIAAATVGISLLSLTAVIEAVGIYLKLRNKRRCAFKIFPAKQSSFLQKRIREEAWYYEEDELPDTFSNEFMSLIVNIENILLFPLYYLTAKIKFLKDDKLTPTLKVSGWQRGTYVEEFEVLFPHRGYWEIECANCLLNDSFLITNFLWSSPLSFHSAIKVGIKQWNGGRFPLIVSASRSGDEITSKAQRKEGDYYDLKEYHPSDGIKRIVWRLYAKSGELFSRKPEEAVVPEARAIIFVFALPQDDAVCSAVLAYLNLLARANVEYRVGCLGMEADMELAVSEKEAAELFLKTVWNSYIEKADCIHNIKKT